MSTDSHSLFFKYAWVFLFWAVTLSYAEDTTNFRYNPEILISLPQPLQLGVEIYREESFRYFADFGVFKFPFSASTKSVSLISTAVGVRYFPWNGRFYGTLGVGFSRIAISTDVSALKLDGEQLASFAHVVFSAFFIGPALGVSFDLSTRLRLAIEIGVRIPVLFSGSLEMIDKTTGATSANSETLKVSQGQAMSRIAGLVLPTLTLLRFTWLL